MALITKPYTFTNGTVANAIEVNADYDIIYTLVNGNLDNANIAASAGIVFSKLDSATVAGVTATQTLTNKTLTAPIITGNISGNPNFSAGLTVATTTKVGLNAGGTTYWIESSANKPELFANGSMRINYDPGTGFINLSAGNGIVLQPTVPLFFDGGSDTKITESSANNLRFTIGGNNTVDFKTDSLTILAATDLVIQSGRRVYWDGQGDTYSLESSANVWDLVVGNVNTIRSSATALTLTGNTSITGTTLTFTGTTSIVGTTSISGTLDVSLATTVPQFFAGYSAGGPGSKGVLNVSGQTSGGGIYGIWFTESVGTLTAAFNFNAAYTDTTALGAFYGRIPIHIEGVGTKYISLYS